AKVKCMIDESVIDFSTKGTILTDAKTKMITMDFDTFQFELISPYEEMRTDLKIKCKLQPCKEESLKPEIVKNILELKESELYGIVMEAYMNASELFKQLSSMIY
ncbi:MAG: hypothetical protein RR448_10740, partial [Niameybacter sp.]